jgi:uncharacterized protein YndB with AHSA1/START domain
MVKVDVEDVVVIDAPRARVWDAVHDPSKQAAWNPFVDRIDGRHALDAVRQVTGHYGKAEGTSLERCVAYEPGRGITWIAESDSNGFSGTMATDVIAQFTLADAGTGRTEARYRTAFVPQKFYLKLMAPALRGKVAKKNQSTLRALKAYVEAGVTAPKGG